MTLLAASSWPLDELTARPVQEYKTQMDQAVTKLAILLSQR
jgi:hypothetical protein